MNLSHQLRSLKQKISGLEKEAAIRLLVAELAEGDETAFAGANRMQTRMADGLSSHSSRMQFRSGRKHSFAAEKLLCQLLQLPAYPGRDELLALVETSYPAKQ